MKAVSITRLFRAPSRMRRLRPSVSLGVLLNYDRG